MSIRNRIKERRSAMDRIELSQGAVMAEMDGWRQPLHFGSADNELKMLRENVGLHDLSPKGAVRLVGDGAITVAAKLSSCHKELAVGLVRERQIAGENGTVSLLELRLTGDEIVFLTAPGDAVFVTEFLSTSSTFCVHSVDISSGLAGAGINGPKATSLLSMITELNVSSEALPDLHCVQSRFAGVQGLLIRQDVSTGSAYQLYFAREYGEYIWEAITQAASYIGGGPVGTEAIRRVLDGC